MKIDKFARHKSTHAYLAAKYPCVLMYIISTLLLFIPYLGLLAWLLSFFFMYKEQDSKFLRLHAAQSGFIFLFYSIINLSLKIIADIILSRATSSRSETAFINALQVQDNLNQTIRIIQVVILLINAVQIILAYNYRFWNIPLLSSLARRLEKKTDSGPLR